MILGIILLVIALFFIVVGTLAWTGHLPGNSAVGIRVPEVRKSREIWAAAHKAAGPMWVVGGVALVFGALMAFRADGWLWLGVALAVVAALFFIGGGANIGAKTAASLDVRQRMEEEKASEPAPASKPSVDLDALRRAAGEVDKNQG